METMAWTDERLEERFNGIDRRFDEVDRKFEAVDRRFDRVEGQIATTRTELKGEISVLQAGINRVWISMVTGLLGVIAAILVKGG
jgi:DNA anti-recombination protein RmuC